MPHTPAHALHFATFTHTYAFWKTRILRVRCSHAILHYGHIRYRLDTRRLVPVNHSVHRWDGPTTAIGNPGGLVVGHLQSTALTPHAAPPTAGTPPHAVLHLPYTTFWYYEGEEEGRLTAAASLLHAHVTFLLPFAFGIPSTTLGTRAPHTFFTARLDDSSALCTLRPPAFNFSRALLHVCILPAFCTAHIFAPAPNVASLTVSPAIFFLLLFCRCFSLVAVRSARFTRFIVSAPVAPGLRLHHTSCGFPPPLRRLLTALRFLALRIAPAAPAVLRSPYVASLHFSFARCYSLVHTATADHVAPFLMHGAVFTVSLSFLCVRT